MVMQIRSFGDLDSLKEGDFVFSPTLVSEGEKYACYLEKFKIKNFLSKTVNIETNSKVCFDKFDVVLEKLEEDKPFDVTTNLRKGFCTDDVESKKQILVLFKEELKNMVSAIDKQIKTLN